MGSVSGGGVVQLPGEARTIDVGGFTVVVHAGAGSTSGAFSLIETVEAMAGSGPPLHVHRDAAESFYVIEGEYVMHLDGRDFRCPAGSFVYVPRVHAGLAFDHDLHVGRKRVARLMRGAGLEGVHRRRGIKTTRRDLDAAPDRTW